MKKALSIVLIFSICLVSCKKEDDDNSSSSSSSSANSVPGDFMISITVDGVTHKAEGNIPSDLQSSMYMFGNHCLKYANNTVIGGLADKSDASYVSGEVFCLNINFPNLSIGNSVGILSGINGNGSASIAICNFSNINFPNGIVLTYGLSQNIDTISSTAQLGKAEMNFNITDLGTIGSVGTDPNNYYTFGNPLRGSFSGTMYGCDGTTIPYTGPSISYGRLYNIPVQIEIEFIAARRSILVSIN